jgi:hypothetical protein
VASATDRRPLPTPDFQLASGPPASLVQKMTAPVQKIAATHSLVGEGHTPLAGKRRMELLIEEGWVVRCRNRYYFDFDKFRQRQLSSHLRSLSTAITMAARTLRDPGLS